MSRHRKTGRLVEGKAPLAVLRAVEHLGGVMHIAEYRATVATNCATASTADDCRKRMLMDGLIEVYAHITPRGRELLAGKDKGSPCDKPARTAAGKATSPTAAPVDSTPLSQAWMTGRR